MAEEKSSKPDKKPDNPEKSNTAKKSKTGLIVALVAAGVLLVAGLVALLVGGRKVDPSDPKASLGYSSSFFIYDNSKYTLWNAKGERVTEDEYDYKSDFLGGYAYVKKDDQVGILREDGKMTVDFGKYGSITATGGLYLAQDGNTKKYTLLNGTGSILAQGDDLKLTAPNSSAGFALLETADQYRVYTFSGFTILATNINQDSEEEPKLTSSHDLGAFYYNNQNVIFDARTDRVLARFEGERYTFDEVAEDRTQFLVKSEGDNPVYKLITLGGAIYDLNETKYYGLTELDNIVVGYDDYDEVALLGPDYKVAKRVNAYVAVKDVDNYAAKTADGNVEVVYKGNVVKTFDQSPDVRSGLLHLDYYAIKNDNKFKFYRLDGSPANDHEYAAVWSIFDRHHHAIVADTEDEYYLIDGSFNRLTENTYKRIYSDEGGYELKTADGKYVIANLEGKVMTDAKYESVYYRSSAVDHNIWTGRYAYEDHDVLDIDHQRVLLEHVNVNSFYENYFTVKNSDGKYDYYTYDGVKFYTSQS